MRGFSLTLSETITTSGIICYGNTSISGGLYTNKDNDIFYNGAEICNFILSLNRLIKTGISNLTVYNLSFSGKFTTSGIIFYRNTSISDSVNISKDIFYNGIRQ